MNSMRKLIEAASLLNESSDSLVQQVSRELEAYFGESVAATDLEIYGDGMSFAILYKPTDEQFLYSDNGEGEFELEDAEFDSWPPPEQFLPELYNAAIRAKDFLTEYKVDNKDGLGSVPNNQNVDYMGLRVLMKPSVFLKLARTLVEPGESLEYIANHIKQGGALGAPFLYVDIPEAWMEGDMSDPAEIEGHEGRHRMKAVRRVLGDDPVEVHIFFRGGLRNRHITPEFIKHMNHGMIKEDSYGLFVPGPLFQVI